MASHRLDAAWGPRPWRIDKVPQLRKEVRDSHWRTRDGAKGAGPAVCARNTEKIEKLEELAWSLTTAGEDQISDFFYERRTARVLWRAPAVTKAFFFVK